MASYSWPPSGSGGGGGGVTSVGLVAPMSVFTVTGSPVTTSGDLVLTFNSQTANTFFAAPNGSSGTPQFRPIVAADLPIGNLTDVGTDGIVITGGTGAVIGSGTSIAQHVADTTHNGYLSSADWNTFNGKQAALTFGNLTDAGTDGITVVNGANAVIGTGTSFSQHVADSSHNGYLSSTDWNTFNGKQAALTFGNLTDAGTDGIVITGGTGAVIGTGTSLAQHVADTTHNGYLSSADWNTFNGKQNALTLPLAIAQGGTGQTSASAAFNALSPMTTGGDLIYGGASGAGTRLPNGTLGQTLISGGGTSAPSWLSGQGLLAYLPASTITGSFSTVTNYTTVSFDTASAFNPTTGVYTAPYPGIYLVCGAFLCTAAVIANLNNLSIAMYQNSTLGQISIEYGIPGNTELSIAYSFIIKCAVNDTIALQISSGATTPAFDSGNPSYSYLNIGWLK